MASRAIEKNKETFNDLTMIKTIIWKRRKEERYTYCIYISCKQSTFFLHIFFCFFLFFTTRVSKGRCFYAKSVDTTCLFTYFSPNTWITVTFFTLNFLKSLQNTGYPFFLHFLTLSFTLLLSLFLILN